MSLLLVRRGPVNLEEMQPAMRAVFQAAFRRFMQVAEIVAKRLAGVRFQRRTGALERGIGHQVLVKGLIMEGALTQAEVHGIAQELGAAIPARLIRPRRPDGVLHWVEGGVDIFARMSRPGPFTLPPRPYLQPALEITQDAFFDDLHQGVEKLLRARGA